MFKPLRVITVLKVSEVSLKPNEQRSKSVLSFIWIVLILESILLVSSGLQYKLLKTVASGGEITTQAANANDVRELFISIIYLIAYVISGIAFIMQFRRTYFNLYQIVNYHFI